MSAGFSPTLFAGGRYAVLGLGRNGVPVAHALAAMGASVHAWDDGEAGRNALGEAPSRVELSPIASLDDFDALVLCIVGGLFVVETLSVIIQVGWYKRTGKRVFLMAPLHHHFEKLGWEEPKIVIRFWIVSIVLGLAGLATLKIR